MTDGPATIDDVLVWGIDPSTVRVAVAAARTGGELLWARTLSLPKHARALKPRELAEQMAAQQAFFRALVGSAGVPGLVAVERPFAGTGAVRKVPVESHYAFAVTLAALAAGVGRNVRVVEISPTSWKARGLGQGNGHASKEQVMAWCHEQGMVGVVLQDEADACGIARAALTF